jgi:hypothetical protein
MKFKLVLLRRGDGNDRTISGNSTATAVTVNDTYSRTDMFTLVQ